MSVRNVYNNLGTVVECVNEIDDSNTLSTQLIQKSKFIRKNSLLKADDGKRPHDTDMPFNISTNSKSIKKTHEMVKILENIVFRNNRIFYFRNLKL